MTKVRYVYLQNALVLGDAGEYVFDVSSNDIISRLDIEFKATNGATNNKANTIADVVTSIELMNGAEPILSLSGLELAGMVSNRNAKMPIGNYSEDISAVQFLRLAVDFGRWYCDEDMALDLSKFSNLQMRVKWNLAAITAVGATGFITGSSRLTVLAHVMEGGRNPVGYLSLKRHALYTTQASGIQPVYLPLDKPIRAIGIRSYEAAVGQLSGISTVRLIVDENKYRPIDLAVADFLESLVNTIGRFHYKHTFHAQDANVLYTLLKHRENVMLNSRNAALGVGYANADIGQGVLDLVTGTTGAALAVDTLIEADVNGYLPFSTAYYQFGSYDDPNSWFDVANVKGLRLELEQNNAGASMSVLLEQQNNY